MWIRLQTRTELLALLREPHRMSETCPSGGTERQMDMWLKLNKPHEDKVTWNKFSDNFEVNVLLCGQKCRQILSVGIKKWGLAHVSEQKQHSETHSFSVGKKDESDYQQITWLIRAKPMLIEISYGSQAAFLWEFGQSWTGERQVRVKLQLLPSSINLKWSTLVFSLLSFSLLSPSSPLLPLLISTLLGPSLLSFPVAGNSHNCRPKFPSIAGGSGVWLGWVWMLSSSGSLSATSKQRMLLPTLKALLHTWQTGRQESEYSYLWSWSLWSWQIEKNAWLTTVVNWGGLSGITRSSLGPKVPTVKQPERQAEGPYQLQVWVGHSEGAAKWV